MKKPKVDWMEGQKFSKPELVEIVKAHALQMYEHQGWDLVVETVSDGELRQIIENSSCRTKAGAVGAVQSALYLHEQASYRSEIQSLRD